MARQIRGRAAAPASKHSIAHDVAMLIGIVLVTGGIVWSWQQIRSTAGLDFYQFWIGGQVAPHEPNIYTIEARHRLGADAYQRALQSHSDRFMRVAASRRELELFSTPFLYTCFAAFPKSYDSAYLAYAVIVLIAFLAAMVLLGRSAGLSWPAILFATAFILFLFQPFKSELRVANVNSLELLMLAAYTFLAPRSALGSGVTLALAIAFKPNLVLILPLAVIARLALKQKRELLQEIGGLALGGVAAVAISSLWFRSTGAWLDWLTAARNLSQGVFARADGNVAAVLGPVESFGSWAAFAVAAILTAVAAFALWRGKESAAAAAAIGPVIYLLSAPLVWLHYLLLAIPLAIWILRSRSLPIQVAAIVALVLVSVDPGEALLRIHTYSGEAALVGCGLALLFVTGMVAVWRCQSA